MYRLWFLLLALPVLGGAERFSCRGRILGAYYADAKSGCKAFHVCVRVAGGGVRDFRFFCPPGTLFHQEAQTCTDWGDDDELACPVDIYDGSFDLYKIGSGFDTKKVSSNPIRDEEPEFGLQRAESGDRRSHSQNNVAPSAPASDLRAAHSSDFFSGQRERGRDESAPPAPPSAPPSPAAAPRQSFRRPTSPRDQPTTTVRPYTPEPSPQPSSPQQYNINQTYKRKLVRKRPVYSSTAAPTAIIQSTTSSRPNYPEETGQNYPSKPTNDERLRTSPPAVVPPQYKDEYVEVSRVAPKPIRQPQYQIQQQQPQPQNQQLQYFQQQPQKHSHAQQYFPNSQPPTSFVQSTTAPRFTKKLAGLAEIYNYEAQSTPPYNGQNEESTKFKVRNSFNVAPDVPRESSEIPRKHVNVSPNGQRASPSIPDYSASTRSTITTTASYRNFNSVSYEPEKKSYSSGTKQTYLNGPTVPPTTSVYTTTRAEPPLNLNTVAYNTNIGFNAQSVNYAESDEDDGQYRLPAGEDDGQYRPELYERELLSGAHSLNIAASGNRLPEDQKPRTKSPHRVSHTASPSPFRPAPTSSVAPPQTTRTPEPTYFPTTTARTQPPNPQRNFDYFQTYTTTSRPTDTPQQVSQSYSPQVRVTTAAPQRVPEQRVPEQRAPEQRAPEQRIASSRAPAPSTAVPPHAPTTRTPPFARPSNNKEDASYDYAYYDTDPGFSEYDQIEEFGKTKKKL